MKKFTSQGKFLLTFPVAILSMLLATSIAQAKGGWLTTFNNLYGTANTRLDTCGVCHVNFNKNSALNVYGDNFVAAGGKSNQTDALQAIEGKDPDSDEFSSLAEINSLFLPGWNCDNIGSAVDAPADVTNFVDPDGCGVAKAPDINLNPDSLDFGVVTIGSSSVLTTQVQNLGNADLNVTSIALSAGSSAELTFAAPDTPFTIPPGGSQLLTLTYAPADLGMDTGALDISSDDSDEPTITLNLTGTVEAAPTPDINLNPDSLDFGVVTIGSSSVLTTQVQNLGNADLNVTAIDLCIGTSTEFSFSPSASFTLVSGASQMLTVTYTPVDVGDDIGCMEIVSNDPDEPTVELGLTAVGEEPPPVVVDLEIAGFRVTKRISLRKVKPINLELVVKNSGALDEPREATVVGVQNGIEVYNFSMMVSDPVGGGRNTWVLPDFTPDAAGDIVWTATINDNTRDVGAATATTTVVD